MKQKFLVFSPHPDDLDFGASGTVAKLTNQGNEVVYCIVTNGEKGTHKVKSSLQEMIRTREKEQKRAAKIVGVKKTIFLRERDGEVENTKQLRRKLVKVLRKTRPDVVLSPDPASLSFDNFYRYHRDHRVVGEAVFDALYPAAGSDAYFPDLSQKPHSLKEAWFFATDNPNLFINISQTIHKKIQALKAHKSQIKDPKRLEEMILSWAKKIGKKKKIRYAEAFRIVKL